jgi:hypothetical protein
MQCISLIEQIALPVSETALVENKGSRKPKVKTEPITIKMAIKISTDKKSNTDALLNLFYFSFF